MRNIKVKFPVASTSQIILIGFVIRLIVMMIFTHVYDSGNIIAFSKSIADTGNLLPAYNRVGGQLFGKIYYQVIAFWLKVLQKTHLVSLSSLFVMPRQSAYMSGYPSYPPEMYQYVLIKMVSFLYDSILLLFLFKFANLFGIKNKKAVAAFWAFNPFLMYVGYVMLQSDLAMIAFLTAGVYFAAKALKNNDEKIFSANKILSMVFLAIGADIKQIPLLILPIVLILISRNLLQFIFYILMFAASYFLVLQPWSLDAILIKKSFINSQESTNLFLFQINGVNVFFFLYFILLGYTVAIRERLRKDPMLFIMVITLVIAIVFFSEDISSLFVQFGIWILPFLGILSLNDSNFTFFLPIPFFIFIHSAIKDGTLFTTTLSTTFGEPFHAIPTYQSIIDQFISSAIVYKAIDTLVEVCVIFLILYLVNRLMNGKTLSFIDQIVRRVRLDLIKMSIVLLILFFLSGFIEFLVFSQYTLVTNYSYPHLKVVVLDRKPLYETIANPHEVKMTGASILVRNNEPKEYDNTIIQVMDLSTNKILFTSKTNDLLLPQEGYYDFYFPQPVQSSHIQLAIFKEKGLNSISIFEENDNAYKQMSFYPPYDSLYTSNAIIVKGNDAVIAMNIRGNYSIGEMVSQFIKDINEKKQFMYGYFIFISLLIITIFFLGKIKKE